jgi:hypothetical protein
VGFVTAAENGPPVELPLGQQQTTFRDGSQPAAEAFHGRDVHECPTCGHACAHVEEQHQAALEDLFAEPVVPRWCRWFGHRFVTRPTVLVDESRWYRQAHIPTRTYCARCGAAPEETS